MAYRTHITIETREGRRVSPEAAIEAAPGLASFTRPGTRHGRKGLWLESGTRDLFRYEVSRVESAIQACGFEATFGATNAPSLGALHTTLRVSKAVRA
jgi:hypothetical protein